MDTVLSKFRRSSRGVPPPRETPSVFEFTDLPSFLRAYAAMKRARSARWSLGVWARRLGLRGDGTLSNLMKGTRSPAPDILEKMKRDFAFTDYEALYFDAMVSTGSRATSPPVRTVMRNRMFELTPGRSYREISPDDHDFMADPLTMILREAVKLEDFRHDPDWISKRLRLVGTSPVRIRALYGKLIEVGLLKWEGDRLIQDSRYYETPANKGSEILRQYYENSLDLNRKAVRKISVDSRHLNSITFCCDSKDFGALKDLITDFTRKTMEAYDRESGRCVYQLHVQLVPHILENSE